MGSFRMVLKDSTTRGAVEFMALDFGWAVYTVNERSSSTPFYKVWVDGEGDNQSVIIYTDDSLVNIRYLSVHGREEIVEQIRASVDVYSEEELKSAILRAGRHDEWIHALMLFGVSLTQSYDAASFLLLERGLEHADARVRLAAIAAIGYPAWVEFVDRLRPLASSDDDHRVRARAERMIDLLEKGKATSSDVIPPIGS